MKEKSKLSKKSLRDLFKKQEIVEIESIISLFSLSSIQEFEDNLIKLKIDKEFEICGKYLVPSGKKNIWGKLKHTLRTKGKFALGKTLPIAIGIATGGIGLGLAIAPIVAGIVGKFQSNGVNVDSASRSEIEGTVQGKPGTSVGNLSGNLQKSNSTAIKQDKSLESVIKLTISEELTPIIAETQECLAFIQQNKESTRLLLEEWATDQKIILQNQSEQLGITLNYIKTIQDSPLMPRNV